MLLATVRNSVLCDEDDTLRVTLGARERWWRGSKIRGAPTRFGLADLAFSRTSGEASWSWSAVPVWTALTLPPGAVLDRAPPAPLLAAGATRVLAPPGTREARVRIVGSPERP
jgi:hypothetical protein